MGGSIVEVVLCEQIVNGVRFAHSNYCDTVKKVDLGTIKRLEAQKTKGV